MARSSAATPFSGRVTRRSLLDKIVRIHLGRRQPPRRECITRCSILTITLNPALDVTTTTRTAAAAAETALHPPLSRSGWRRRQCLPRHPRTGRTSTAFVVPSAVAHRPRTRSMLRAEPAWRSNLEIDRDPASPLPPWRPRPGCITASSCRGPNSGRTATAAGTLSALEGILAQPDFVVASGSLPPGLPDDFYGQTAGRARKVGARLILDTHGEPLRSALGTGPS